MLLSDKCMDELVDVLLQIQNGRTVFEATNQRNDSIAAFQATAEAILAAKEKGLIGEIRPIETSAKGRHVITSILINRGLTYDGRQFLSKATDASARVEIPGDISQAPLVFISYSHDSKDHKSWVAALANRLLQNGVNVLLDLYDLGPGDDIAKFMEKSVRRADRVLMICTETYVRKADDGKGGVGYEAMIVTGELIRDLGTNKFIPIVRQAENPKSLPVCIRTRLYVDLSDGTDDGAQFETLLREIHNAPKTPKPPLGPNPFTPETFEGEAKKAAKEKLQMEFSAGVTAAGSPFHKASEIIRANDRVAWRRFLIAASDQGARELRRWKMEKSALPDLVGNDWSVRFAHTLEGVNTFAPLIVATIAAAESGKDEYAGQLGWVESILKPTEYGPSETVYFLHFPPVVFFVAQALAGGMLMISGCGNAEYRLAITKLSDPSGSRAPKPLFSMPRLVGHLESLNINCTTSWTFLDYALDHADWIKEAFGNVTEARTGIAAHYHMLSFLNFIAVSKSEEEVSMDRFPISTPLNFCTWPKEVVEKGYTLFLNQRTLLQRLLKDNGIELGALDDRWKKWLKLTGQWFGGVYPGFFRTIHFPQSSLPKDLQSGGDSYAIP